MWLLRFMKVVTAAAVTAASLSSCTTEMDLSGDGLDKNVTLGGEALTLPLGSTKEMTLGDFMNLSESDVIKVDGNGNYYIEFSETFGQTVSLSDFTDQLTVEGLSHYLSDVSLTFPEFGGADPGSGELRLDFGMNESFAYEFSFEEAREKGLVRIYRINLENVYLTPNVRLSCGSPLPASLRAEVQIEVPDRYVFEESSMIQGNVITYTGSVRSDGSVDFQPLKLTSIEFDYVEGQEQQFIFRDDFAVRRFMLYVNADEVPAVSGAELTASLNVHAGDADGRLYPVSFEGRIDVTVDPVTETIEINDIPDILKGGDVNLDFYAPAISASITTNSTVPVNISAGLTPVFAGGNGDGLHVWMPVPASSSADQEQTSSYWISNEQPSDLQPGYEWLQADVKGLLRRIPDAVNIDVGAGTDSGADVTVDCGRDYQITGSFDFNIPFSFGDGLYISLCDTLKDMPEIMSTIVRSADMNLSGEVYSTVPVDVELSVCFLDASLNMLDIPAASQLIGSTDSGLEPRMTPLDITVSRTDIAEDIYAVVLKYSLLPGQEPGVPLSGSSSIRADLVLGVPGGITLDLNNKD